MVVIAIGDNAPLTALSPIAIFLFMKLVIEKAAAKRLAGLQPSLRAAILERLAAIAEAPFDEHANVKALKGEKDLFRLRVGDWRVIYRVVRIDDQVRVVVVETRGDVYR